MYNLKEKLIYLYSRILKLKKTTDHLSNVTNNLSNVTNNLSKNSVSVASELNFTELLKDRARRNIGIDVIPKIWRGTLEEYDSLTPDDNTIYIIT